MNKILTIAAASTLSLSISSVVFAGDVEKIEYYSAPLEQQAVELGLVNSSTKIQELGTYKIHYAVNKEENDSDDEDFCELVWFR